MTEFTIRAMLDTDRDAVIDLLWELNRFENAITGNRSIERSAAIACLSANDQRLQEHGGVHLVAVRDAVVIGYICAVVDMAPVYVVEASRRHVSIADLVVTSQERGAGAGRALIQAAEAFTRRMGLRQMLIGVVAGNDRADRLYSRMGYKPYAMERIKTLD